MALVEFAKCRTFQKLMRLQLAMAHDSRSQQSRTLLYNSEEKCYRFYFQVTYNEVATNETHSHCYEPLVRKCDGEPGKRVVCRNWPETYCSTKYLQKKSNGGQFVSDTNCQTVETRLCAPLNCEMVPGPPQCHDQVVASVHKVPEEVIFHFFCRSFEASYYKAVPYPSQERSAHGENTSFTIKICQCAYFTNQQNSQFCTFKVTIYFHVPKKIVIVPKAYFQDFW